MMASIFNTAASGLSTFQSALAVVGNNITNSATPGYSRQTIQLVPSITQKLGNGFVGTGVSLSTVVRNADQFANYQVRNTYSVKSQFDTFYQQASQVDQLLSQNGVSLSSGMQDFFTAFSQMNSTPADPAARTTVMKQSQLFVSQFTSLQSQLNDLQSNSTVQIKQSINQINTLTTNIASLNKQLLASPNSPDLLDQRDNLIQQLSQYADLNVINQDNGNVSVNLSDGTALVSGPQSTALSVGSVRSTNYGTQIFAGNTNINNVFNSGSLKGLLDFENNVVGKTSQIIGQMAIGLAQAFNAQNSQGLDLNGQLGGNYFTDYNSTTLQQARSSASPSNTGTATLGVAISDISQTQISDYQLTVVDAANHKYNLVRKSDGATTALTWDGSSANFELDNGSGQTQIDGLSISADNFANLATGDSFTIAPTRGAASNLSLALSDFSKIALAGPVVQTAADSNNTSQTSISLEKVYNTNSTNTPYTITFDAADPTIYRINSDPTPYTLTNKQIFLPPGSDNTNASYSVKLSGAPNTNDVFNLTPNAGGVGDNGNGLLLAGIQNSKMFAGGTESLVDSYANLVAGVGADTNDAKLRSDSADVIYNQALDFQSSKSGVNLDEEGANLLRFQQAYQAAGKLLQVANQMMDVLFQMG